MTNKNAPLMASSTAIERRPLTASAQRALEEARLRRKTGATAMATTEVDGPKGPDPTRYGDWERNGIVSDF